MKIKIRIRIKPINDKWYSKLLPKKKKLSFTEILKKEKEHEQSSKSQQ